MRLIITSLLVVIGCVSSTALASQTRTGGAAAGTPAVAVCSILTRDLVGETAYFRSNRDRYAELMAWTATHYFTLQVSVPTGKTVDAIKPDTIALANAIIAKLR